MTPTTRETADHAELLEKLKRVKYVREAHDEPHGTYDQPCDADDYGAEAVPVNPDGEAAADALENLLSEIAALRVQVETEKRLSVDNWNVATDRATQAERQRDEAVGLLRPFARLADEEGGYREADRLAWGLNNCEITWGDLRAARTFLANQGADR